MEASSSLTSSAPAATITPAPEYQPESWPPVFLLGARPLSLDGHIFTQDGQTEGGFRFRIDCPTANVSTDFRTREDDAGDDECRRADLFPAEVYHEQDQYHYSGSNIWGGTLTPSAAPGARGSGRIIRRAPGLRGTRFARTTSTNGSPRR